jgi:hypothetical protein
MMAFAIQGGYFILQLLSAELLFTTLFILLAILMTLFVLFLFALGRGCQWSFAAVRSIGRNAHSSMSRPVLPPVRGSLVAVHPAQGQKLQD